MNDSLPIKLYNYAVMPGELHQSEPLSLVYCAARSASISSMLILELLPIDRAGGFTGLQELYPEAVNSARLKYAGRWRISFLFAI